MTNKDCNTNKKETEKTTTKIDVKKEPPAWKLTPITGRRYIFMNNSGKRFYW